MAAIQAFRKPNIIHNLIDPDDFDNFEGRLNRYQLLWSFYENTSYDDTHKWVRAYKKQLGLYRYNRNVFTPANRLGNFHQTHIWGGALDMEAGNGDEIPSALPIITDEEAIREPLANIWKWSNWQRNKNLVTLQGAVMGDSFIRVVDNPIVEKVYFEIIHPKIVKDITKDDFGNVKGYILEEERDDPRDSTRKVTYTEIAKRDESNNVMFTTLLDNSPYAWNGIEPQWIVDYGFIPFVHNPHIDVGNVYGWSEIHAGRSKFQEVDDLASQLSDYIRKEVQGLWLLSGVAKPKTTEKLEQGASSSDRPQPGREEKQFLYGNTDAGAISLIADLDISAVVEYITTITEDIERDYPELMLDDSEENSAESGTARRIRQQPAASKIMARRAGYDGMLVAANNMALSIGAMRGYEGFKSLSSDGFERGDFEHSIGKRDVFGNDRLEDLQEAKLFWETATIAKAAGIELSVYLKSQGWSDKQINEALKATAKSESLAARRAARVPPEVDTEERQNEQTSTDIIEANREATNE